MSRHSPSRQSSFSYIETPSRRSSTSSNPNIFSDDYALEPIDAGLALSLEDSIDSDYTLADSNRPRDTLNITPYPAIPTRLSGLNRPSSILKRPAENDDGPGLNDATTQRTLSTSSRFSFVRSQSPYSGPTQPSHPYAMYPQITRASSVASGSTIRAHENPFIPVGGPEHPYSLYPQNTVPVDADEDIGTQPIPLGFPRLGLSHAGSTGNSNSDVGDIIGSDGHIEQLPPYTRYADNVVAKGDMANINSTSTISTSRRPSQRSTLVATESIVESPDTRDNTEQDILLNEEVRKETWKDKAQRKVCGGIALWLLIAIIVSVVFAGIVGGVVGGIVGRHQGEDLALAAGATQTVWLDYDPAYTNKDTPACPTGKYTIPFQQTQEINSCVVNNGPFGKAWACLDIAFLGITISDTITNGNKTLQVRFEDYSVDTTAFRYGPQPPDLNGTTFDLRPSNDRDNRDLGVAMFFYEYFDKLTILPTWAIKPGSKRFVEESNIFARGAPWEGAPLRTGDEPWYCFWNSTINEFWIFLQQPIATTSWTISSTATPMPNSTLNNVSPTSGSTKSWGNLGPTPTPTVGKRDVYTTPYYPQYPQLVRMVEKRKPIGNVQPYCQKMRVLDDWQVVPSQDKAIIYIKESQYQTNPLKQGITKRDYVTQELESNCVCEWMSK